MITILFGLVLVALAVELVLVGRGVVRGVHLGRQRAREARAQHQVELLRSDAEQRIVRITQDAVQAMLRIAHEGRAGHDR